VSEKSSNSTVIIAPECMSCVANTTSPLPPKVKKYQGTNFQYDEFVEVPVSDEPPKNDQEKENEMHSMMITVNVNDTSGSPNATTKITSKRMLLRLIPCLYNKVTFSPDNRFLVRECLGPGVPTVTLHSTPDGRLLNILDNSTALKEKVAEVGFPLIRIFSVKVSDGYIAPVKLYLPPGLREDEEFKFPLVLHL
jgi:dipeptidyl aminopeptidase/acylaminoacyl peptidase